MDELLDMTDIYNLNSFCKDNRKEHFYFEYRAKDINKIHDVITKELRKEFSNAIDAYVSHMISHLGFTNKNLQNRQSLDAKYRTANDIASDIRII